MPKKTFYNLTPEKQEVIMSAARKEFARVPLAEASIAKIIKEAEIARGSFYQYFEDKDDLFMQVAAKEGKEKFRVFIDILTQSKGDLLEAIQIFFQQYIDNLDTEENKNLQRNIFLSMNEKMRNKMVPAHQEHPCRKEFKAVIEGIDQDRLGLLNEKEFRYLGKMLNGVLFRLLTQFLNDMTSKQECLAIFEFEMDIIKRGIESRKINK